MLAVVAGDLIMLSDVTAAVEFGLVPRTSGPDVTRAVLSQLIDRSLMLAEVERYAPPEPERARPSTASSQVVRERFASAEAFDAALTRVGVEETAPARNAARQPAPARLPRAAVHAWPTVGRGDRRRYYREHADVFTRDGRRPAARRGAR